ncbi:hypothetical protein HPB51_004941 [Rhipicephalus microplus]|uniref:Peptidase M13 C-terminal domain-containing protein n=1 Tax=Rhipicephalus microplus TaxID=6941 RepID=A0A9J6EYG8_RHIMP|nr:hypothetical protein HPB51_004941 [Rhipicephalus microplus]
MRTTLLQSEHVPLSTSSSSSSGIYLARDITHRRQKYHPGAINYRGETRRARQADLDAIIDSENLADIVGVAIAHAAFASLPLAERNVTLPGLNLTAEHLFFISHCAKWCESERVIVERYAPGRSRCIVPLMNMAAFSEAFQCAPNTPMNPSKKCSFW